MAKQIYLGDGVALTKKEYLKARKRFYHMVTKRKIHKTGKVY